MTAWSCSTSWGSRAGGAHHPVGRHAVWTGDGGGAPVGSGRSPSSAPSLQRTTRRASPSLAARCVPESSSLAAPHGCCGWRFSQWPGRARKDPEKIAAKVAADLPPRTPQCSRIRACGGSTSTPRPRSCPSERDRPRDRAPGAAMGVRPRRRQGPGAFWSGERDESTRPRSPAGSRASRRSTGSRSRGRRQLRALPDLSGGARVRNAR